VKGLQKGREEEGRETKVRECERTENVDVKNKEGFQSLRDRHYEGGDAARCSTGEKGRRRKVGLNSR